MGMFDDIICNYPLPGEPPEFVTRAGYRFQTKDLECTLATFTISAEGQIDVEPLYTGTIHFYNSNICGSGPGLYTPNGEDAESVDYQAYFVDGRLQTIEEIRRTLEPALPRVRHNQEWKSPIERTPEENLARRAESMVGRRVYVLMGGQEKGYWAEVVAEGPKEWCLKDEQGELDTMDRRMRDHLLWDTEEEALGERKARMDAWAEAKREYDEYAEQWHIQHER